MAYTRIVPYNDHDDATLTPSAAAASGFPVTDTQNDIRSRVWRSTSTATQSITGVVSASRVANHASLWRLRGHGASVRFQLFSDAGATAQVYDSGTVPLLVITATDAYTWSTGTNDPFFYEHPFWLWFTPTTYRSYKWTFSGTPTLYSYFQVSRIVVGKYLELTRQPQFGLPIGYSDLTERSRSYGGSLRTNVGGIYRTMSLDLGRVEDEERPTWMKIRRQLGTGRSFVLSIYPGQANELERDYMGLWKFSALDPIVRDIAVYRQRLQLEEVM